MHFRPSSWNSPASSIWIWNSTRIRIRLPRRTRRRRRRHPRVRNRDPRRDLSRRIDSEPAAPLLRRHLLRETVRTRTRKEALTTVLKKKIWSVETTRKRRPILRYNNIGHTWLNRKFAKTVSHPVFQPHSGVTAPDKRPDSAHLPPAEAAQGRERTTTNGDQDKNGSKKTPRKRVLTAQMNPGDLKCKDCGKEFSVLYKLKVRVLF